MGKTLGDGFVQWEADEYDTGALVYRVFKVYAALGVALWFLTWADDDEVISGFDTKPELDTAESALMDQLKLGDTYY
ncbi:unnamed protein product [Fusarium fujikuroi]|uniref:Uncharacterized protein n=1 Tax=Fusarium fujikuroi TaxID=5127 RepID=A0A9Q9RQI0_FUSFU|nr:unnamed protein product [Fusarium fujikuroi]VTT72287.1 unnamed protein product [Fusarium fujikuroi]